MASYKVGYFVGSLAKGSINRTLSKALIRLAPQELEFTEIPIKDLPLYSYDYDANYPARGPRPEGRDRRRSGHPLRHAGVQPRHPRALKNAIDWASRPWGQNSFTHKPSGIVGASPGAIGTAVGQQSLRSALSFCNSPLFNEIEAYITYKPEVFGPNGEVNDEATETFLRNYMAAYLDFIVRVTSVLPPRK